VALLARAGAELEHEGAQGKTALAEVCGFGSQNANRGKVVAALLAAGADPRHADAAGYTPLDMAILAKNLPAIEALEAFLAAAFLDRHRANGATDWKAAAAVAHEENLLAFVHRKDLETVRNLLDAGLEVATFTRGRHPVLFAAVEAPEIFDLALDRGADPFATREGSTLLHRVASAGTPAQLARLLRAGLDPNASNQGEVPLCSARDLESAQLLLDAGARVNPVRAGWTPLMRAVQRGSLELVDLLLSLGADANIVAPGGKSALSVAQDLKDKTVSKAMAKRLARITKPDLPDARGRTALFHAAVRGDVRAIAALLARGAKPDLGDRDGVTPAEVGALRAETAKALGVPHAPLVPARFADDPAPFVALRRREAITGLPDVKLRNTRGDTLLHLAVALADRGWIDRLLEGGADIAAKNGVGDTPWSTAIALHGMGLAELIQKRGGKLDLELQVSTSSRYADFRVAVRAGDLREVWKRIEGHEVDLHLLRDGETPLGLAAAAADAELVALLLEAGADVQVPTAFGSVANEALDRGQAELGRRLLDAGAPLDPKAMQSAAERGELSVVRMLVGRGQPLEIDPSRIFDPSALMRLVDFALEGGLKDLAARASEALAALTG
jgi:ankyrin repeat protein